MHKIICEDRLQAIDILMKSSSLEEMTKDELIISIKHILNKKDIRENAQRLLSGAVEKVNEIRE